MKANAGKCNLLLSTMEKLKANMLNYTTAIVIKKNCLE